MKCRSAAALLLAALLAAVPGPRAALADDTDALVDAVPVGEDRPLGGEKERATYQRLKLTVGGSYRSPRVRRGDGRALSGADLYHTFERPDLAAQHSRVQMMRLGLVVAGGAALVAGGYYLFRSPGDCPADDPDYRLCDQQRDERDNRYTLIGIAGLFAGLGGLLGGWYWSPHGADRLEVELMARAYNRKLRRKLGVLGFPALGTDARLEPTSTPGGLGLRLVGTF